MAEQTTYRVYYTDPAGHRTYRKYDDAAKADRMAKALDGKVVCKVAPRTYQSDALGTVTIPENDA